MRAKGWFIIPGVQDGDRTFEEQFTGLEDACEEAAGKTVLDLGCAEGLISAEFAKRAKSVVGVDVLDDHLAIARQLFGHVPNLSFMKCDLRMLATNPEQLDAVPACDIVLACGVVHKLREPQRGLEFAVSRARSLFIFRNRATDRPYLVQSKHHPENQCMVDAVLKPLGWNEEKRVPSTRGEAVQYWRKC